MMPTVTCIGEAIVDFVSTKSGYSLREAPVFKKAVGGAPANVAVGLARLGTRVSFVGKVGDDPFGRFLEEELRSSGVDTAGMRFDRRHRTRLAFVSLGEKGERDFSFWERAPADEQLRTDDIRLRRVAASRIVHISSFLLLSSATRSVALRLAALLCRQGCLISFDPNVRLSLWRSPDEARKVLTTMVRCAHILRLNLEEARFLSGAREPHKAADALRRLGPELVVITDGANGCVYFTPSETGKVSGFRVRAVDTTGCGDAFLAGLLHGIAQRPERPGEIPGSVLREICRFSNAAGALTALRRGAAAAMPGHSRVIRFLNRHT